MTSSLNKIVFIFGVSGSGKTTLGQMLAVKLNARFFDADDYHPEENIVKMQAGNPLNDEDRRGWLQRLHALAKEQLVSGTAVIACSALKEDYRRQLMSGIENSCIWFLLNGSSECISERMKGRKGHYMPASLLKSQFDILEVPSYAISFDVASSPEKILDLMLLHFRSMETSIGIVGMGVMGRSLARNFGRNGFKLSLFNQRVEGKEEGVALQSISSYGELKNASGFEDITQFVGSLSKPRVIICMIPSGDPMDMMLQQLLPLLDDGDIIVDGGNSHYKETERRQVLSAKAGINFIGAGISGGEEGALNGPSIMVGGNTASYDKIAPLLGRIAAKDKNNNPCVDWIGESGAGHFVKMVHNGIEYAEMQLLAEVYSILRIGHDLNPDQIAGIFTNWLATGVDSYLLLVSRDVLRKKENTEWLVDKILDKAENKGTGSWTTIAAAELGVPIPTIAESLFARYVSAFKEIRKSLEESISPHRAKLNLPVDGLKEALQLCRISNHHQGFHLIETASKKYSWNVNLSALARIWTNGCIIRSQLMEELVKTFQQYELILSDSHWQSKVKNEIQNASQLISKVVASNIPAPAMTSALIYLQSMTLNNSNANLIQAQRDYFGAHRYQRTDDPSGSSHHTNWKQEK
ncbi:MAG TPA: NADP-dependent phosphogluconate dehydrogenase [Cyclobacteriaceae bacterium]|nr:NADP-dependent phosphogluconate dehydrogenase [Cyclobacteriaceae bacterium]